MESKGFVLFLFVMKNCTFVRFAACAVTLLVSFPAFATTEGEPVEERTRLQGLGRVAVGYATDPLPDFPSAGVNTSILLGLRLDAFVIGLEGVYFVGSRIEGVPSDFSGSETTDGYLRSLRANLLGQYELRWSKLRLAPTVGLGVERTTLTVDEETPAASGQLVLMQGVGLGYELNRSVAFVLDQRFQQTRFDDEWGFSYWAQLGVEFSF